MLAAGHVLGGLDFTHRHKRSSNERTGQRSGKRQHQTGGKPPPHEARRERGTENKTNQRADATRSRHYAHQPGGSGIDSGERLGCRHVRGSDGVAVYIGGVRIGHGVVGG